MMRPKPADLVAAIGRGIPDVIAPGLAVLFCGINPGLWSAATGHHFARPGNRFWPALHRSGFTPRLLSPDEEDSLLACGLGITNLVERGTSRAGDLTAVELCAGRGPLEEKVTRYGPKWLAIVGVTAYRTAYQSPTASIGPQPDGVGGTRVWVLPNPSGLNAHYSLDRLSEEFARLRAEIA